MTWPLSTLLFVAALLWADGVAGGHLAGDAIGLLALSLAAGLAGLRSRVLPLSAAGLAAVAVVVLADQEGASGRFSAANDGVFYSVIVLGPCLVGWLIGHRRRQGAELQAQTAELRRRRTAMVLAARAAEVERIERRVDQALADRLRAIIEGVQDASRLARDRTEAVPVRLHEVEVTARSALEELRSVLGAIRTAPVPEGRMELRPTPRGRPRVGWPDVLLCLAGLPLAIETAGQRGPAWVDVALALADGPALCLVRRRTLLGTLPLLVLALVQTAFFAPLPPTVGWFVPGLALAFLIGAGPGQRRAVIGLAVLLAEVGAITLATPAPSRALGSVLPSGIVGLLSWGAGRWVLAGELRADTQRATVAELARTRDEQVELATSEQRAAMARELHDVGAHSLTVVCLQAGAVQALWERDPQQAREALGTLVALADDALSDLLHSLSALAQQPTEQVLDPAALDVLAGVGRLLGLRISISVSGVQQPVIGATAQAAFRVVQESLTNVARYAPGADVTIAVHYLPDALDVTIGDCSARSAASTLPGSGGGLSGMQERVRAVNGTFEAGPVEDGFRVHVRLPLHTTPDRLLA